MKKALHLFDSSLENESRLLKTTQILIEWGLCNDIVVIGYWRPLQKEVENIDTKRVFLRVKLAINTLSLSHLFMRNSLLRKFIALWSILQFRLFIIKHALKRKPDYISVHNPTFLITAIILKAVTKAKIFYVPHELESERTGINTIQKKYVRFLETLSKAFLNYVIFVSPLIEKWYRKNLGYTNTLTIRNIPINPFYKESIPQNRYLKDKFGLKDDEILFVYQGIINQYRGISPLLEVFQEQAKHHIVFMGFGEMVQEVIEFSKESPFIHYHPPVSMKDIINVTSSADVSLFFVNNPITLSYQLTTANKFYEGIIAGTPFIISNNFTYMSSENVANDLGWSLDPDLGELKKLILTIDMDIIIDKKKKCLNYGAEICWREEAKVLKTIY